MLDSPLEFVTLSHGAAARVPSATATSEQAIKTEAGFDSQAGLALFLLHAKYL
jgi:hypothetical protein